MKHANYYIDVVKQEVLYQLHLLECTQFYSEKKFVQLYKKYKKHQKNVLKYAGIIVDEIATENTQVA